MDAEFIKQAVLWSIAGFCIAMILMDRKVTRLEDNLDAVLEDNANLAGNLDAADRLIADLIADRVHAYLHTIGVHDLLHQADQMLDVPDPAETDGCRVLLDLNSPTQLRKCLTHDVAWDLGGPCPKAAEVAER